MNLDYDSETMRSMNCIEVLEIRVTHKHHPEFQLELESILKETAADQSLYKLKSYSKGKSGTDYLLIIHHRGTDLDSRGSNLGQVLMEALGSFGMIHRSVWFEMEHTYHQTHDQLKTEEDEI